MNTSIKQLFAAAALTLLIGGSIGANALTNTTTDHEDGWFGQKSDNTEMQLQDRPSTNDCDGITSTCAILYVDGLPDQFVSGGPYNP